MLQRDKETRAKGVAVVREQGLTSERWAQRWLRLNWGRRGGRKELAIMGCNCPSFQPAPPKFSMEAGCKGHWDRKCKW